MNVILSIKPKYADAIFAGKKKVEFRKSLFKEGIKIVLVYSSSPVQRIIGYFTIEKIVRDSPHRLWEKFGEAGFIDKENFFKYFADKKTGYSICIDKVVKFPEVVNPFEKFDRFTPPQSFCYYNETVQAT
jgi:predicted transcriptional regulator